MPNPFLPLTEYIPDGEPHVFGDRVYLYGSHDAANSVRFCAKDYAVWSAPVNDLSTGLVTAFLTARNKTREAGTGNSSIFMRPTACKAMTDDIICITLQQAPIPRRSAR